MPETYRLGDAGADRLAKEHDYVLKPVNSCAGKDVRILKRGTPLPALSDEPTIVQRYVPGTLLSSFSIVHEGRVLLTVVYRGTVMTGTVAVGFERVDGMTSIEHWIDKFAGKLDLSGFVSFDFIIDADGRPFAIECNPRVTSGIHFVETDDLAPVMLDPDRAPSPRLRRPKKLQQFWPSLTETQASIFHRTQFRRYLKSLIQAKEVTWSLADPLPFLLMPFTSMGMLWMAMTTEKTLGEAATHDIEYHAVGGEAPLPVQEASTRFEKNAAPGT